MPQLALSGLAPHSTFFTVLIVVTQTAVFTNCYQRTENVAADVGGSAIFNCSLELSAERERNENYGFKWIKEGEEIYIWNGTHCTYISQNYKGRFSKVSSDALYSSVLINITNIQESDQGQYECKAIPSNPGKNGTLVRLEVHSSPDIAPDEVKYVNLDDAITIECKAKVTIHSNIVWYKDNNLLEAAATIGRLNRGAQLIISKVRLDDIGNYTCLAKVHERDTSHTTRVVLAQSAIITVGPRNRTVLDGEKAMFAFQVSAVPENLTVKWFRDGILVDEFAGLKGRVITRSDGFLIITVVNEDDSGQYLCEVHNGFGEPQSAAAYLNVEYPARVTFTPSVQYLPLSFAGVVNCYIKANPPMQYVMWIKDNRPFEPYLTNDTIYMNNGSLFFIKVNHGHHGVYSCIPYNHHGTQGGSGNMDVIVAKPPTFIVRPNDVYQGQLGDTVEMHCDARKGEKGTEQPAIHWHRKDGTHLPKHRVRLAGGNITIEDLRTPDFGFYQCVVSNEVATAVKETQLVMEGIEPRALYNFTANASATAVTLSWLRGIHSDKQDYIVWYREVGTSEWSTVPVIAFGSTGTTVDRLKPSTAYEFHVVGTKRPGRGDIQNAITIRTLDFVVAPDTSPDVLERKGLKSSPPYNLTVTEVNNGFLITWLPPLERNDSVQYYNIQYKSTLDGPYRNLNECHIRAEETSFLAASLEGGQTYYFRVLAYTNTIYESSDEVEFSVRGKMDHTTINSRVVVGILICMVAIILLVGIVEIRNRRKRRKKEKVLNVVAY